jgi:acyl carrier protein
MIDRNTALDVVSVCLRESMAESGNTADVTEDTVIVGKDAVLDSVEVVALIVNIEQKLEIDHDVSVTLASDKAMSQRSSPFRTVGVLADHVIATLQEGGGAA